MATPGCIACKWPPPGVLRVASSRTGFCVYHFGVRGNRCTNKVWTIKNECWFVSLNGIKFMGPDRHVFCQKMNINTTDTRPRARRVRCRNISLEGCDAEISRGFFVLCEYVQMRVSLCACLVLHNIGQENDFARKLKLGAYRESFWRQCGGTGYKIVVIMRGSKIACQYVHI